MVLFAFDPIPFPSWILSRFFFIFMIHFHDLFLQILLCDSSPFFLVSSFCFNLFPPCHHVLIPLQIKLPMVMLIRCIIFILEKALTLSVSHLNWMTLTTYLGQDPCNVHLEPRTRLPSLIAPFRYLICLISIALHGNNATV